MTMKSFDRIPDPVIRDLMSRWQSRLSAEDLQVVELSRYGREIQPGAKPAVILVDIQYGYVGEDRPIVEQLDQWPSSGGSEAWTALRRVLLVLEAAREACTPVVFSRIAHSREEAERNTFVAKRGNSDTFIFGHRGTELVKDLDRRPAEPLLTKTAASAFYGTKLDELLRDRGVDTLLVCGLSTSGCVRATVVDGAARGFRMLTVADCVADRISLSHDVALFDIWLKYGAVVSSDAAVTYLKSTGTNATAAPDSIQPDGSGARSSVQTQETTP